MLKTMTMTNDGKVLGESCKHDENNEMMKMNNAPLKTMQKLI